MQQTDIASYLNLCEAACAGVPREQLRPELLADCLAALQEALWVVGAAGHLVGKGHQIERLQAVEQRLRALLAGRETSQAGGR